MQLLCNMGRSVLFLKWVSKKIYLCTPLVTLEKYIYFVFPNFSLFKDYLQKKKSIYRAMKIFVKIKTP